MTSLSPLAALAFLIPALPIGIWVAWSDMKTMKIPNKAVMALGAGFLIIGLGLVLTGLMPFTAFLWALALGLIVLVAGFLGNAAGLFGAGDAKFAAVMAPFFIGADEPQDDWTSQNIHCDKGGAHSRTAASGLCVRLSFSRYLWRHRE